MNSPVAGDAKSPTGNVKGHLEEEENRGNGWREASGQEGGERTHADTPLFSSYGVEMPVKLFGLAWMCVPLGPKNRKIPDRPEL